ncbi:MAG: hypothetical protein IK005_01475 [Paludibacteraceae bacterium]|nr:hypothetical protein [Paludibacteraceae bacterium]
MKTFFVILSLGMLAFSCSSLRKSDSDSFEEEKRIPLNEEEGAYLNKVLFKDIPQDLLENLLRMDFRDSALVTLDEGRYLNVIFENSRKEFDFIGKKVGFFTGSSGKMQSSKADYFELEKDRYVRGETPNGGKLYVFDEKQKEESGGYDAAIVYWSKFLIPEDMVVKRLSKGNRK